MVLLIDNYDSFVHTLARYCRELGCETLVVRNDRVTVDEIRNLMPRAIILSPGPCTPAESGITLDVVRQLSQHIPTLGVCLGHQAIAAALGGQVVRAPEPVHGMTSDIWHDGGRLFTGLANPFSAMRYHSLVVASDAVPRCLTVTARTADGIIMGLSHQTWPLWGVQFHPESILTQHGRRLLHNFLSQAGIPAIMPEFQELTVPMDASSTSDFYARPIER